ncbi:hypothetical protein [Microcystis aeruginosa]|uniref:hypothetical protein n=1 Tax=Microcystis aeruginosa TaxID=1126 RepID=UPI00132FFCBA|nr:hypothetical protein [Microcystis aeruginosa]
MRTISNITLGCCSQYNRQLQIIVNNLKKKKLPSSGDRLKSCLSALPTGIATAYNCQRDKNGDNKIY